MRFSEKTKMFGFSLAALCGIASIDTSLTASILLVVSLLGCLFFLVKASKSSLIRSLVLMVCAFFTARYMSWRIISLSSTGGEWFDLVSATGLFCAEGYSLILLWLSLVLFDKTNSRPVARLLDLNPDECPNVDVLIPTYNEPVDVLETTLLAAISIRYPKNRFKVYLLDDGATLSKLNDFRPEIRKDARERAKQLQKLCESLGVIRLTRSDNQHAKAGNLNAALPKIKGDILLVLDADHVAHPDILRRTVPFFKQNSNLAIVQLPHAFINPDPIKRNLKLPLANCGESDLFFYGVQPSLNQWNASFFCGSAGLIARNAIDKVGGFATYSITEDAATSLNIHAAGFESIFYEEPLAVGLQPFNCNAYIRQRSRWAQGMMQILLLDNPLKKAGLTLSQRFCYFAHSFFWLFSYARLAFILSPLLYVFFKVQMYPGNWDEVLLYAIPQFALVFMVSRYIYGSIRQPFVAALYELIQSIGILFEITKVFIRPHSPIFNITPKSCGQKKTTISSAIIPFYALYGLNLLALVLGCWELISAPKEGIVIIGALGWIALNVCVLNGVFGALTERRAEKEKFRVPVDGIVAILSLRNHPYVICKLDNLSVSGAQLVLPDSFAFDDQWHKRATLFVLNPSVKKTVRLHVTIRQRHLLNPNTRLDVLFHAHSLSEKAKIVSLLYGNLRNWQCIKPQPQRKTIVQQFLFFARLGITGVLFHIGVSLQKLGTAWENNHPKRSISPVSETLESAAYEEKRPYKVL